MQQARCVRFNGPVARRRHVLPPILMKNPRSIEKHPACACAANGDARERCHVADRWVTAEFRAYVTFGAPIEHSNPTRAEFYWHSIRVKDRFATRHSQ